MWSTCNLINTYIPQQSKYLQREIKSRYVILLIDEMIYLFQKRNVIIIF